MGTRSLAGSVGVGGAEGSGVAGDAGVELAFGGLEGEVGDRALGDAFVRLGWRGRRDGWGRG